MEEHICELSTAKKMVLYNFVWLFCITHVYQNVNMPSCIPKFSMKYFFNDFFYQMYTKSRFYCIVYHKRSFLFMNTNHIPIILMYTELYRSKKIISWLKQIVILIKNLMYHQCIHLSYTINVVIN